MKPLSIYQAPTALSKGKHKNLRFTPQRNFSYTKGFTTAPVAGYEFFEASRDFPVLFIKDSSGNYLPIALLTLLHDQNRLTNDKGKWNDLYIPAFFRQYPFALSTRGTVYIDEKAPHFSSDQGSPVLEEDGSLTKALKGTMKFLGSYDLEQKRTAEFCKACQDAGLFSGVDCSIDVPGKGAKRLKGLYAIDEKKFKALPENQVTEWFRRSWLAWSYAHLHSLGTLHRMARQEEG